MLTLPSSVRVFVFIQPTDIRCGFNKLSILAKAMMGQDPLSGHLFVYFNRRANRYKVLFWDRTGYCIWYKQLQQGTFEVIANEEIAELYHDRWTAELRLKDIKTTFGMVISQIHLNSCSILVAA